MQNQLLHTVFILFFSAITLYSCKSEDKGIVVIPDKKSYVKSIVDGDTVEATYALILQDREFNAFYPNDNILKIQRYVTATDNRGYLIRVERFPLKTLSFPSTIAFSSDKSNPTLAFVYYDKDNQPWSNNQIDNGDFSMIITGYQENKITGTFSGKVYRKEGSKILSKEIKNGDFNVKLKEYNN